MKLNKRQEAFCLEYAKCGNATQAYKKAGYTAKNDNTAGASGAKLLKNDKVRARLAELAKEAHDESIADIAEIQSRLTAILRGEQQEQQVVVEGCGDGVSEARLMDRKPLLKDVIKAGETLAKMQGAFDNNVNVSVVVPTFVEDVKK